MEVHEIKYFLAVVRELNFTRAATACGITQPALTRAIKKLENEFGGPLFLRRPGGIELTRLARELLPKLQSIEFGLSEVKEKAAELVEEQSSSFRLGVMCTVGPAHIVAIVERLQSSVVDLDMTIVDAKAEEIVSKLLSDEIDIAISAWPKYPEAISALPLLDERYAVAMSSRHPLSAVPHVTLEELARHRYLDRLGCEFDHFYSALLGDWTHDLNIAFASEREDWIKGLLQLGVGCAIVPEFMEMPEDVVMRPLIEPEVTRKVSLLSLRGKPLNKPASQFARLARSHQWRSSTPASI